jgi:hypothetical protein
LCSSTIKAKDHQALHHPQPSCHSISRPSCTAVILQPPLFRHPLLIQTCLFCLARLPDTHLSPSENIPASIALSCFVKSPPVPVTPRRVTQHLTASPLLQGYVPHGVDWPNRVGGFGDVWPRSVSACNGLAIYKSLFRAVTLFANYPRRQPSLIRSHSMRRSFLAPSWPDLARTLACPIRFIATVEISLYRLKSLTPRFEQANPPCGFEQIQLDSLVGQHRLIWNELCSSPRG